MEKVKQHLEMLRGMDLRPNFSELARIYGIDRRTVKKYWEGYRGKPKKRNKSSKLDKYFEKISMLMSIKGITIRAAYERLRDEEGGVVGTYSNFRKYVKRKGLRPEKKTKGHPRFETLPGIQAQVDWKENMRLHSKDGEEFVVNVFNYKLGYSRYCYFEYRQSKTQQDIFECLINAFKTTGGVPQEILFDNMKSVVDITESGRKINNKMKAFARDFGFKIKVCKPRHSYTKGKVESANKFLNWLLAYDYAFESEEELKDIIRRINRKVNTQISQATNVPPLLLFQKEKEYLSHLPRRHIVESYVDHSVKVKVQKDSLIYYKGNKYSVPIEYIGKTVNLKINENYLYVYYTTELIAVHEITDQKINYLSNHYMALMRKHIKDSSKLKEVCENNLNNLDKFLREGNV
ncbi:IS21 family transposase [Thermosipho sp. 1074]|uniref:IS21 family transposase n=1 Tax=Thermosipho sp. 1074 TaxID=1643331 RepID=UPI000984A259|nr:integrase [Thermosipho sp. 1074]